jgi:hypothetical protein
MWWVVAGLISAPAWAQGTDAEKARAMLDRAVAEVRKDEAAALEKFTKGLDGFRDGTIYPFCFRRTDGVVVTGQTAGRDIRVSFAGETGQQIYAAGQRNEGTVSEVTYQAPKPGPDRTPVPKTSLVTPVQDLACGVGFYPAAP